MAATRAELYRLGISAGGGARETARITRETDRYNQQLAEQERRLRDVGERQRKLNAIRAKADKMRDVRNNPAGNGAGMMAAGVTTGATLLAPIRAYSESENAANQLAGSMMGPGGKVAPEFMKLNKLAIALGDRLPGTTADFQNMMTMLRRQGMSAQVILGGLGESAAYLGVQLQMAPTEAAEFAAKLQDATQTTEKRHDEPDGSYPAWFLCGRRPREYAAGFRKYQQRYGHYQAEGPGCCKNLQSASRHGRSGGDGWRVSG